MQDDIKVNALAVEGSVKGAGAVSLHTCATVQFQITPAQLRAARSFLDWTRNDLAKASGLSPETIRNIEHGTFKPQESTLRNLLETLSAHGVEFFSTSSQNVVGVALVATKEQTAKIVS